MGFLGLSFISNHPEYSSQSLFAAKGISPIVLVQGSRLPNILQDNLFDKKKLLFYQMMLVLFKPFSSLEELLILGSDVSSLSTWKSAYEQWNFSDDAKWYL